MVTYMRRLLKLLIYLAVIFLLFIIVPQAFREGGSMASAFRDMFADRQFLLLMLILAAYILAYPLVGFARMERHLNGSFSDNRSFFEDALKAVSYMKTEESADRIVYRRSSKYYRFMQFGEDRIVLETGGNPVIISGPRRTVARVNQIVEQKILGDQV